MQIVLNMLFRKPGSKIWGGLVLNWFFRKTDSNFIENKKQ